MSAQAGAMGQGGEGGGSPKRAGEGTGRKQSTKVVPLTSH